MTGYAVMTANDPVLKRLPGVINELGWGQCLYGGASAYMVTLQSRSFEQLATMQCNVMSARLFLYIATTSKDYTCFRTVFSQTTEKMTGNNLRLKSSTQLKNIFGLE